MKEKKSFYLLLGLLLVVEAAQVTFTTSTVPIVRPAPEINRYDMMMPYPDRASQFAVEIYHSKEDIEALTPYIDESSKTLMASKGNRYACFKELKKSVEDSKINQIPVVQEKEEESLDELLDKVLKSKLLGKCFQKKVNYWTYVICPFDKIEQVHFNVNFKKGERKADQVIQLGRFDEDASTVDEHVYGNGDDGRSVTLKIKCPAAIKQDVAKKTGVNPAPDIGTVTTVAEPKPHHYEITFETSLVCDESKSLYLDPSLAKPEKKFDNLSDDQLLSETKKFLGIFQSQCVLHLRGWWTYEVCFSKGIRQYHKNKDGSFDEFTLGLLKDPTVEIQDSVKYGRKVAVQRFVDGTECDLTGKKRETELIYKCVESVGFVEVISVEESISCGYIVVVSVPLLCSLPGFSGLQTETHKTELQRTICFVE